MAYGLPFRSVSAAPATGADYAWRGLTSPQLGWFATHATGQTGGRMGADDDRTQPAVDAPALSMTIQRFSREIGFVSSIDTVSPTWKAPPSS